jgi:uncharacterized membrane protein YfcA
LAADDRPDTRPGGLALSGPAEVAILVLVALCAGIVDAVAGGGGLLTVPVLTALGLPPHLALGTNKGQSTFGAFSSLLAFARAGWVDRRRALFAFPLGFAGSLGGAAAVFLLRPEVLRPVVLVLLLGSALFVGLRRGPPAPAPGSRRAGRRRSPPCWRSASAPTTASSGRAPAPSSSWASSACWASPWPGPRPPPRW